MKLNLLHFLKKLIEKPIIKEIVVSIFISALVSSAIAYKFSKQIDQGVANRDYIYNFSRTFFDNPKYRDVSVALEEKYLYNKGPIMLANGGKFTDYQVDDYLTHLTELYLFGDEGFISFDLLNYQFGYYVCITYNNQEIQEYIKRLKSIGFTNPYKTLDYLAEEMDITSKTDCKKIEG